MLAFLFFSLSDQVFLSRERETSVCSDFFFFFGGGVLGFLVGDLMFSVYLKKCLALQNC